MSHIPVKFTKINKEFRFYTAVRTWTSALRKKDAILILMETFKGQKFGTFIQAKI